MADCIQPVKKKAKSGKRVSLCVGCGSQIHDQYILRVAPDLEWHASCLKCAECAVFLDESCTCFVRDGKTYCKRDYVRLFGTKCAKCLNGFSKNDFVMRAKNKIYHIDCFRCVACSRQLIPGDEFALREDGLFCKADHDVVEKASTVPPPGCDVMVDGTGSDENKNTTFNNNNNNESKNGIKANTTSEMISCNNDSSSSSSSKGSGGSGHRSGSRKDGERKTTRVRTVLNEKQLHTLRTCYGANPRPDALMKEQLTEMTGLSPRVIRVWFQNKRCKDKKRSIYLKQMQQQQQEKMEEGIDAMGDGVVFCLQGVPMVASSPVRHEPNIQANPVEVQSYQAPWKALSEFAMQSDMEQAPFQQLVNSFDHHDTGPCEPHQDMGTPLPPHPGGLPYGLGVGMLHDDHLIHPPNSVSSDNTMPGTPSEMSSPLSQ